MSLTREVLSQHETPNAAPNSPNHLYSCHETYLVARSVPKTGVTCRDQAELFSRHASQQQDALAPLTGTSHQPSLSLTPKPARPHVCGTEPVNTHLLSQRSRINYVSDALGKKTQRETRTTLTQCDATTSAATNQMHASSHSRQVTL